MYYHHALLELEAKAHTRELIESASAPSVGNVFQRFFRRADSPARSLAASGTAHPTPAA